MKRPLASFADVYDRWVKGQCGRGRPPSAKAFRRLYDRWRHRAFYRRNAERRRQQRLDSKKRLGKAHRYLLELRRQEQP